MSMLQGIAEMQRAAKIAQGDSNTCEKLSHMSWVCFPTLDAKRDVR
jgi:hypothetical protein